MRGTGNSSTAVPFDTARTVLVPAEIFGAGTTAEAVEYLRTGGMELSAGETALVSEPLEVPGVPGGIVAIMGVSVDEAEEITRGGVRATSPLLSAVAGWSRTGRTSRRREVNVLLTPRNAYLAVWEKELQMAEALPDNSADSLLYYMQVLARRFELRKFDINVCGDGVGEVVEMLRAYYPRVRPIAGQ